MKTGFLPARKSTSREVGALEGATPTSQKHSWSELAALRARRWDRFAVACILLGAVLRVVWGLVVHPAYGHLIHEVHVKVPSAEPDRRRNHLGNNDGRAFHVYLCASGLCDALTQWPNLKVLTINVDKSVISYLGGLVEQWPIRVSVVSLLAREMERVFLVNKRISISEDIS